MPQSHVGIKRDREPNQFHANIIVGCRWHSRSAAETADRGDAHFDADAEQTKAARSASMWSVTDMELFLSPQL